MKIHAVYIDAIFVILVALLALNALMKPVSEELSLPPIELPELNQSENPGVSHNESMVISMECKKNSDPVIYIRETPVKDKDQLTQIIKKEHPLEVVLRGDSDLSWGQGVDLLSHLNDIGVESISIACKQAGQRSRSQ